ncbi:MAG: hypothetical protein QHH06_15365 [Clostridiales bacterium]|jgi:CRISPR/Cas system-associated protein Csx1|nr:hypothetical protein [Eubacteriales bacterium]MDH7567814.1 hypothetical protein [Clostridiales bacterium]
MFKFSRKKQRKFDRKILKKNDISLLILDERWNNLFTNTQKTPEIAGCEEKLRDLLKQQSRLIEESREISARKKACVDMIIQLTPEVFDKNDQEAKDKMQDCEKDIRQINDRLNEIEKELESIPDRIKDVNLELLEHTVNVVYFKMKSDSKRIKELEALIEETRAKLKEYFEERELLSQDNDQIYSYFHDLLGREELEKLDKEFFE